MNNPIAQLPRQKKPSQKPEPPASADTKLVNLHRPTSAANVQLQFQVSPDLRRAVKAHAAENDLNLSELFVRMWDAYRRENP